MSRSIEIEMKYEVVDPGAVAQVTDSLVLLARRRIKDVYLDTRGATLFTRGIFLRVRNGEKLDLKFNEEDLRKGLDEVIEHTHCDEVSVALPLEAAQMAVVNETLRRLGLAAMDRPGLESLRRANSLIESVVIDKERSSYEAGEFHIDVDVVRGLGEFVEIEKMTDEHDDREAVIGRMKAVLRGLALRHVDVGYNELYWRKHDFDLYLRGKYLLAEDRVRYRPASLKQ